MRQRQGTILKKCGCVKQARWSDEQTLRYRAGGRPRELSFAEELDGNGRPRTGRARGPPGTPSSRSPATRARMFIDPKLAGNPYPVRGGVRDADQVA
jgi:hypothetical protein